MSIFKAYDIRGIYGEELDEKLALKIGRAFVTLLGCKKVAIGRDVRPPLHFTVRGTGRRHNHAGLGCDRCRRMLNAHGIFC